MLADLMRLYEKAHRGRIRGEARSLYWGAHAQHQRTVKAWKRALPYAAVVFLLGLGLGWFLDETVGFTLFLGAFPAAMYVMGAQLAHRAYVIALSMSASGWAVYSSEWALIRSDIYKRTIEFLLEDKYHDDLGLFEQEMEPLAEGSEVVVLTSGEMLPVRKRELWEPSPDVLAQFEEKVAMDEQEGDQHRRSNIFGAISLRLERVRLAQSLDDALYGIVREDKPEYKH
jgi:hypothetical protein